MFSGYAEYSPNRLPLPDLLCCPAGILLLICHCIECLHEALEQRAMNFLRLFAFYEPDNRRGIDNTGNRDTT